ncbi:MAG: hypothetical protein NVS4B7_07500 [Ktedonobacteraceae bacterium]
MNIPIVIGWPQVLLFFIALVGLGLLISSVMGLSGWPAGRYDSYEEEARKFGGRRPHRLRRRLRLGRGLSGVVLLVVAISLLWLTFVVQSYLGLISDIKVARVHASQLTNASHQMSVELIQYDKDGHQASDQTYAVNGDEWMLQADYIKFPTWLNILGVHSGYKLTRLEGRFDDPNLESNARHVVITLNGGDDNFFQTAHNQKSWLGPFVDATYGNATFDPADGTYDIFASQTGLYAKLVK